MSSLVGFCGLVQGDSGKQKVQFPAQKPQKKIKKLSFSLSLSLSVIIFCSFRMVSVSERLVLTRYRACNVLIIQVFSADSCKLLLIFFYSRFSGPFLASSFVEFKTLVMFMVES